MKVTFTDKAIEKLEYEPDGFLKLHYDIEDCGCVVNGVVQLIREDEQGSYNMELESNFRSVRIQKQYAVFFDNELKIDYLPKHQCFMLKSDNEILNPRMRYISKG
ncbi:iron-sulfur cluster biosynthesis family protein [Alkalihalobacillus macyae]|uniref:iron-sulfur cluster biosynthesis family protein n=1 Tax=Guptibacillus hwajinpoensis TaxID=208199 RepID=UPI00273B8164|nr:iron-sulfur cluster biosynthesis family protein [Alkalihalobacillus macyae]MDP4552718.1 iron-sulfur cluster biosynthesis family protein [Alkalihalobacillus macyae]